MWGWLARCDALAEHALAGEIGQPGSLGAWGQQVDPGVRSDSEASLTDKMTTR